MDNCFISVGDLRKLIADLPDDAPILYETNDETLMTFKLRDASVMRVRKDENDTMSFDISYFLNELPNSTSALVLAAHEEPLMRYICQQIGPGAYRYAPPDHPSLKKH